ncbi:glycine-rich protein [Raphanus sativus]|uniref:Uncharacterized protein LOC108826045 n=1 Tax=Raphanus sativus TaxID=3726 RepID=A0A6J0L416_RAPSA|nr:uncharacterized protein LOC108826045 [Raphanus sativus]KAJ4876393.1 glycine-rich protein [Raphanus sativus]
MAVTEGQQVMALISKRLRAHRKKYNRITEMEESVSQGKTLNKEQKEAIRSKPIVIALIEELEKLRLPPSPPPSAAGSEEISLPAKKNKKKKERKEVAEEKDVTLKEDIEECKISDGLDAGEVTKDDVSPCSVSSQDGTSSPPPASSGKPRRKRKAKKPLTSN